MKKNFLKLLNFKISVNYFTFVFGYAIIMFLVCNSFNIKKFTPYFIANNQTDYFGLLVFFYLALALFILFLLLIFHKKTSKFLAILLCFLSSLVLYFINKYDVLIDRTMVMNALYTDRSEVHSLLSKQMIIYFFLGFIVPSIIILKLEITYPKKYFLKSLIIILILAITCVVFGYGKFQTLHRAGNLSRKRIIYMVMPLNYIRSSFSVINHIYLKPIFENKAKNIVVESSISKVEDITVVLAIGETSRQKNFSLYGYEKNTNPLLSKYSDLKILNGKARLGSTLYALPEILTKEDVPLPAVTHFAKIPTSCYVNYSLHDNCVIPGEIKVENCKYGKLCYDEDVIPYLKTELEKPQNGAKLVVLHIGGGSHGPSYHERYPEEFQKFTPICKDADVINKCSKEELFNTFDNTILYVDFVVDGIIKTLENSQKKYVFFYLSDHGESLLEDGRIFHGTPPGIPLPEEQARIPLIVKSSIPIKIKKQDEYPQTQVFDTILYLLNVETKVADMNLSFIEKL